MVHKGAGVMRTILENQGGKDHLSRSQCPQTQIGTRGIYTQEGTLDPSLLVLLWLHVCIEQTPGYGPSLSHLHLLQ